MNFLKFLGNTLLGAGVIAVGIVIVAFLSAVAMRLMMDQGEKGLMQIYAIVTLVPYLGMIAAGTVVCNVTGKKVVQLIRGTK